MYRVSIEAVRKKEGEVADVCKLCRLQTESTSQLIDPDQIIYIQGVLQHSTKIFHKLDGLGWDSIFNSAEAQLSFSKSETKFMSPEALHLSKIHKRLNSREKIKMFAIDEKLDRFW